MAGSDSVSLWMARGIAGNRRPAQALPFEQVQDKVLLDWQQERRVAANTAYLAELLDTYDVQTRFYDATQAGGGMRAAVAKVERSAGFQGLALLFSAGPAWLSGTNTGR